MADDVINQLLLSRAIPGVSFNFIAYVEPEIPGGGGVHPPPPPQKKKFLAYNKTQNSRYKEEDKTTIPNIIDMDRTLSLDDGRITYNRFVFVFGVEIFQEL